MNTSIKIQLPEIIFKEIKPMGFNESEYDLIINFFGSDIEKAFSAAKGWDFKELIVLPALYIVFIKNNFISDAELKEDNSFAKNAFAKKMITDILERDAAPHLINKEFIDVIGKLYSDFDPEISFDDFIVDMKGMAEAFYNHNPIEE